MVKYIIIYIFLINLIGLYIMKSDKKKAIKKKYRIPEKRLFAIALLGGSIGTTAGMHLYRHKTKHWYFRWGMPMILIAQLVLVGYVFTLI